MSKYAENENEKDSHSVKILWEVNVPRKILDILLTFPTYTFMST